MKAFSGVTLRGNLKCRRPKSRVRRSIRGWRCTLFYRCREPLPRKGGNSSRNFSPSPRRSPNDSPRAHGASLAGKKGANILGIYGAIAGSLVLLHQKAASPLERSVRRARFSEFSAPRLSIGQEANILGISGDPGINDGTAPSCQANHLQTISHPKRRHCPFRSSRPLASHLLRPSVQRARAWERGLILLFFRSIKGLREHETAAPSVPVWHVIANSSRIEGAL